MFRAVFKAQWLRDPGLGVLLRVEADTKRQAAAILSLQLLHRLT